MQWISLSFTLTATAVYTICVPTYTMALNYQAIRVNISDFLSLY